MPTLLLSMLPSLIGALQPMALHSRASAAHRVSAVRAMETGASTGGGMMDGVRIGPPPDMPSLLLNNRIVYLGLPINGQVSELIIAQLLYLQYDSPSKPVLMYINSPGTTTEKGLPVGFETEAFSIADTMKYVEAPIKTVNVGKAYGLAAMLLASGEKGMRSTLPYGTVMLHQPRGQSAQGQASDIAIRAREILNNRDVSLQMMSEATGVAYDKLLADTNRCLYLDAQQALDYGIVDQIVSKVENNPSNALQTDVSAASRGLG